MRKGWGKRLWFLVNMYFTAVYLLWRIFFTIPFGYGFVSVFAGLTLLVVEALGMVEAFIHYLNMYTPDTLKIQRFRLLGAYFCLLTAAFFRLFNIFVGVGFYYPYKVRWKMGGKSTIENACHTFVGGVSESLKKV